MASLDTLLDEEVFFGPVTQRELIITWRKRRQERLERERAELLKEGDNCAHSLCSISEPDAMKMSPQSQELEMQAELAHDVQLLDDTPKSYELAEQILDNFRDGDNMASPKEEKGADDDNNCVESELKGAASDGEISINGSLSKIEDEPVSDSMVICNKNDPLESVCIIKDNEDSISENSENYQDAFGGHEDNDGIPSQKSFATDDIPTNPAVPVMDKQNGPPSPSDSPPIKSESPLVKIIETETPESNPVVPAQTASKSNIPKRSILKPSTLNVDLSTLNTSWVKRINMSKIPKPKRPVYVQPLQK